MKCKRKTMCKDCPFKTKSLKGWLGPWKSNEIISQALSEELLACHTEVNAQTEKGTAKKDIHQKVNICVGSMHFASQSCKSYRNQEVEVYRKELGKSEEVFNNRNEFFKHHEMKE